MYEYYMILPMTGDYFKDNDITLKDVMKDQIHFDKALLYYMRKTPTISSKDVVIPKNKFHKFKDGKRQIYIEIGDWIYIKGTENYWYNMKTKKAVFIVPDFIHINEDEILLSDNKYLQIVNDLKNDIVYINIVDI
jgi:hypothetical protein